jgi:hypothetical protein
VSGLYPSAIRTHPAQRHGPVGDRLGRTVRWRRAAVATLVNARDRGLPPPTATLIMPPYADLTLTGATMETKREVDPLSLAARRRGDRPETSAQLRLRPSLRCDGTAAAGAEVNGPDA